MKIACWSVVVGLLFSPRAFADVVCLEKSTGRVLRSQSFNDQGWCHRDIVVANPQLGYQDADLEERLVTPTELRGLVEDWYLSDKNPDKAIRAAREADRVAAKAALKDGKPLTDDQLKAIGLD